MPAPCYCAMFPWGIHGLSCPTVGDGEFSMLCTAFPTQAGSRLKKWSRLNVWHRLKKDVHDWVNICIIFQRFKVHRHIKAPLAHFSVPETYFDCERGSGRTPATFPWVHPPPHSG
ncbi:hypothetical protein LDENG_00191010 [Lucifuga dentata]|nr:hypothetical protein LDENG_00191010 [Lucifuga dentata]